MKLQSNDLDSRRLDSAFQEADWQHRRHLLMKSAKILAGIVVVCLSLWYSGRETVRCDRDRQEIHCRIDRTRWLGTVSDPSRQVVSATGVEVKITYGMNFHSDASYLQGRFEKVHLALLDWEDVERLEVFFEQPAARSVTVQQSTFDNLLTSATSVVSIWVVALMVGAGLFWVVRNELPAK